MLGVVSPLGDGYRCTRQRGMPVSVPVNSFHETGQ